MPELDIQRRPAGASPWIWVIGALVLALAVWGFWAATTQGRDRTAALPAERVAGERAEARGPEMLPIAALMTTPNQYFQKPVRGAATVTEVVSDRGFWVEDAGQRVFVVLGEGITEKEVNIEAGQKVEIEGLFLEQTRSTEVPQLEPEAQTIAATQAGFIRADSVDILRPKGQQS